jgi:LPXTG-site transpeptidase (sortase) family protein
MPSKTKKQNLIARLLLAAVGLSLTAAGSYFLYISLTAKKVVIQAPNATAQASIKKTTEREKQEYTVPAAHPRRLIIRKLGINAIILPVGAIRGAMDAPASAWDVGWYNESAKPGSGTGAMLLDGHVNDALGSPGVFANLQSLTEGDELQIERGDKQIFAYAIKKIQAVPIADVDMKALLASIEDGEEGLNLITCGGRYNYQTKTYDHRVLVFATRKG